MTIKTLSFTTYALYFSIIFWVVNVCLYVFGVSGGKVGISCTAIACLIAHLFYKQQHRFMESGEIWRLSFHCIGAILYNAWMPISFVYFFVISEDKQKLFISLFHTSLLPTAFVSISVVSIAALFATWFGFKGYTFLMKRDIEKNT